MHADTCTCLPSVHASISSISIRKKEKRKGGRQKKTKRICDRSNGYLDRINEKRIGNVYKKFALVSCNFDFAKRDRINDVKTNERIQGPVLRSRRCNYRN